MISLLVTWLVLLGTHFFPAWWNISNTQFSGICLYWVFLRKQSSKAVSGGDKIAWQSIYAQFFQERSAQQQTLGTASNTQQIWSTMTFTHVLNHFCGSTWSEAFLQLPENLPCILASIHFYPLFSTNKFTRKKVQSATGIGLTQLHVHTAPSARTRKNILEKGLFCKSTESSCCSLYNMDSVE